MKLRSLLTYIALFLIGLTIAASCTNPATYITTTTDSASSSAGASADNSLGYSAWPGWFPWQVAQEQKIFEANKASVALKWFDGYLEPKQERREKTSYYLNVAGSCGFCGVDA